MVTIGSFFVVSSVDGLLGSVVAGNTVSVGVTVDAVSAVSNDMLSSGGFSFSAGSSIVGSVDESESYT